MLILHGRCPPVLVDSVVGVTELLLDFLLGHLSRPGVPSFEGGRGSVEPLVLVEADNFRGPFVFVAAGAGQVTLLDAVLCLESAF